jgi:hypothetical protein
MTISSLIRHILGFGTAGSVNIGANTPAPYGGATVEGFVDGTGPQNASKNMAEFYNRHGFAYQHLVEAAGLTFDRENWAQMTQAVIALGGGMHGGTCPITGPAAAPSAATPFTKYTSPTPFFEEWEWSPVNGWKVVSNFYRSESSFSSVYLPYAVLVPIDTWTAPRTGQIAVSFHGASDQQNEMVDVMFRNLASGPVFRNVSGTNFNHSGYASASCVSVPVSIGDQVLFQMYTKTNPGINTYGVFRHIKYVK